VLLATPWDVNGECIAAEQVARLLPESTVTAAFQHLSPTTLANLDRDLSEEDVLVCGDDATARAGGLHRRADRREPASKTRAGVLLSRVGVARGWIATRVPGVTRTHRAERHIRSRAA
jgi:hypothetical protein